MVHWELSWPELAGLCGCPVEALRFSTRVRPVHLAHGGAWARLEALDSLRWPFLDAPVIHGRAVAVRPVLGSGSAHCPGQNPWGSAAPAWRALDPWEAENALWALRRYVLPLPALSCPVDQAFLRSICWPVHAAYREAKRSGDSTLCSATSWRCSACGRSGPCSALRLQLIASRKTVSAGSIRNERLISAWMISGMERPLRIESSSMPHRDQRRFPAPAAGATADHPETRKPPNGGGSIQMN